MKGMGRWGERALRAGFQLHLAKPVQPSELVTVVSSLAARRTG
jgi:CheY-like chemotaxis protein